MFDIKNVYSAESLEQACNLLTDHPAAEVISGGTDYLIRLREGTSEDAEFVSIHEISQLKQIVQAKDGSIHIGAAASFRAIERNAMLKRLTPVLVEAASMVGGPQIRTMGTIGGNLCTAAPSADTLPALLAYNATLHLVRTHSERLLSVHDFFTGPRQTQRCRDEILSEIIIQPEDYLKYHGHYEKYAMRKAMDIATLSAAVLLKISPVDCSIIDARISCGVAAPTPIRLRRAERALIGAALTEQRMEQCLSAALSEIHPRTSWRASQELRYHVAAALIKKEIMNSYVEVCT